MGNSENKKKPGKVSTWGKGLKGQFKSISWPSRDSAVKQSAAVVIITVVLGVVITVVDVIIRFGLGLVIK